jgi:hypothetical protein
MADLGIDAGHGGGFARVFAVYETEPTPGGTIVRLPTSIRHFAPAADEEAVLPALRR